MKIFKRTLMPTLLFCLLAPAAVVFAQDNSPKAASPQSDAKKASRNQDPNGFVQSVWTYLTSHSPRIQWYRNSA